MTTSLFSRTLALAISLAATAACNINVDDDGTSGAGGDTGTSSTGTTSGGGDAKTTSMRLLNVSEGADLSFYIDDAPVPVADLAFGDSTVFFELPAGSHMLKIAPVGTGPDESLTWYQAALDAGHSYSIAAIGAGVGAPMLTKLEADTKNLAAGATRVQLVNARPHQVTGAVCPQIDYLPSNTYLNLEGAGGCVIPYADWTKPADTSTPPGNTAELVVQWGDGANPPIEQFFLDITDLMAMAKDDTLDLYLTCSGECTKDEVVLVSQLSDGSTWLTVPGQ